MTADPEAERHKAKMANRKAVQDAEVAAKTTEKGLLIVNTGPGKGKSTAAFGLALRMLGHGRRIGVVQFIKGAWGTGERDAFAAFGDRVVWHTMGEGFTWETQDLRRDIAAAERGWERPAPSSPTPPSASSSSTNSTSRCATTTSTSRRSSPPSPPAAPASTWS